MRCERFLRTSCQYTMDTRCEVCWRALRRGQKDWMTAWRKSRRQHWLYGESRTSCCRLLRANATRRELQERNWRASTNADTCHRSKRPMSLCRRCWRFWPEAWCARRQQAFKKYRKRDQENANARFVLIMQIETLVLSVTREGDEHPLLGSCIVGTVKDGLLARVVKLMKMRRILSL